MKIANNIKRSKLKSARVKKNTILEIIIMHRSLVLMMCHFFWSPLTLQDTSYSPEPHISADRSQSLLSAQEAVSLWVLGTRKVCISAETPRDAILIPLFILHLRFIGSHGGCTSNFYTYPSSVFLSISAFLTFLAE